MTKEIIEKHYHQTVESLKEEKDGLEFWSARALSKALGYSEYRHFLPVIEKAKQSCINSGHDIQNHFVEVDSNTRKPHQDIKLSRFACYLVIQNSDSKKEVVANGQTYFAIQVRRQELANDKAFHQPRDHKGSAELAANLFRTTQAEDKLRRENIQGKNEANQTHYEVGTIVREAIKKLGGSMSEELPVAKVGSKGMRKVLDS